MYINLTIHSSVQQRNCKISMTILAKFKQTTGDSKKNRNKREIVQSYDPRLYKNSSLEKHNPIYNLFLWGLGFFFIFIIEP